MLKGSVNSMMVNLQVIFYKLLVATVATSSWNFQKMWASLVPKEGSKKYAFGGP